MVTVVKASKGARVSGGGAGDGGASRRRVHRREQISGDVLYAGLPRARVPPSAVACVARARQASRVRTRAYALSV